MLLRYEQNILATFLRGTLEVNFFLSQTIYHTVLSTSAKGFNKLRFEILLSTWQKCRIRMAHFGTENIAR